MNRFLIVLLILCSSCGKKEAEPKTTRDLMQEQLEVASLQSNESTNWLVYSMMEAAKKKSYYKSLIPAAQNMQSGGKELTDYIDNKIKQLADYEQEMGDFLPWLFPKRGYLSIIDTSQVRVNRNKFKEDVKKTFTNMPRRKLGISDDEVHELINKLHVNRFDIQISGGTIQEEKEYLIALKNATTSSVHQIINYLALKIGSTTTGWDRYMPSSIPEKPFIELGETFETDIFLTKYINTKQLIYVNGKEIPMDDGVAVYRTKPSSYGLHSYKVKIIAKNPENGKTETHIKTFEFEVVERCR